MDIILLAISIIMVGLTAALLGGLFAIYASRLE